jgi:hypothetical protein
MTDPLTPRSLLQGDLLRHLGELPLKFETPADMDLGHALFAETINWYFVTRSPLDSPPPRYRVMVENHIHIVRKMDRDEAEAVLEERDIIHTRGLLNAIHSLGSQVLGADRSLRDEPITIREIQAGIRALVNNQKEAPV